MTEAEAVELYNSGFWKQLTYRQRAEFQINEDRLCMPFAVFKESLEECLGRTLWCGEVALNRTALRDELMRGANHAS